MKFIMKSKTLISGFLAALMILSAMPVSADDTLDISTDAQVLSYQDQLAALKEKQNQASVELSELHTQIGNAWEEKLKLDELINITTMQKQLAESQIDAINRQIEEKQQSINEINARIEKQQDAFNRRMVDSYTEKKTDYLELVLGAENLIDFLTKFDYVANIMAHDRKIISQLTQDKEALSSEEEILEKALAEQTVLVGDYEKAIFDRQLLNNSLDEYIQTLQSDETAYEAAIKMIAQQQAEVQNSIEQRILQVQIEQQQRIEAERKRLAEEAERKRLAEEAERKRREEEAERQRLAAEEAERKRREEEERRRLEAEQAAAAGENPPDTVWEETNPVQQNPAPWENPPEENNTSDWMGSEYSDYSQAYENYYVNGKYVGTPESFVLEWGTDYYVSSEQGYRDLYGVSDYHLGTDLACAAGTPIHSYNAGAVLISEYHYSYGNYVLVDHGGGIQTLYAHMTERAVKAGDWVESGQVIGYVGMTGSASGYHLHFEVRVGGKVQNPRNYLKF